MGLLERALRIEKFSNQGKEPTTSLLKRASLLRNLVEGTPEKKKPLRLNLL
ncbi:MAG: hypothetical protein N2442_07470 [Spirochaetes bacterium]|nr:hypothetical protein [Spirochaetota bacterium]